MIQRQMTGREEYNSAKNLIREFLNVRCTTFTNNISSVKLLAISIAFICTANFISHGIITSTKSNNSNSENTSITQQTDITENTSSTKVLAFEYVSELRDNKSSLVNTGTTSSIVYNTELLTLEYKPTPFTLEDFEFTNIGYVTTKLNIRENPTTDSNKLGMLYYNDEIQYAEVNSEWVAINYNNTVGFLASEYISDTRLEYVSMSVSGDKRKSFMDYTTITLKSSPQYKLQQQATTDENGLRMVNGRYCIALGSYYSTNVGQYIDVVLENGTVIPCIVGDCKQDRHTNENHSVGADGGAIEFIVETHKLNSEARKQGDVSFSLDNWNSNVVEVHIYDIDYI